LTLYRDFYYPLNVFMHILTQEEGRVAYLHYGLFDRSGESIIDAQDRSTGLLLSRLPPPPARILDVGAGLGTTLATLTRIGYHADGITPDEHQIAMIESRYGDSVRVRCTRFEDLDATMRYDTILFQESSQYIDSEALFAKARELTSHLIVLDEFSLQPVDFEGALRPLEGFLAAADRNGFIKSADIDVSRQAAPTIDYFLSRFPRYRATLFADLGIAAPQVDALIASGERYRDLYARGVYGYRLLEFRR